MRLELKKERISKLLKEVDKRWILIADKTNLYYYLNVPVSNAALLIDRQSDRYWLLIPAEYKLNDYNPSINVIKYSTHPLKDFEYVVAKDFDDALLKLLKSIVPLKDEIAIPLNYINGRLTLTLSNLWRLADITNKVLKQRSCKDPEELTYMRTACSYIHRLIEQYEVLEIEPKKFMHKIIDVIPPDILDLNMLSIKRRDNTSIIRIVTRYRGYNCKTTICYEKKDNAFVLSTYVHTIQELRVDIRGISECFDLVEYLKNRLQAVISGIDKVKIHGIGLEIEEYPQYSDMLYDPQCYLMSYQTLYLEVSVGEKIVLGITTYIENEELKTLGYGEGK